MRMIDYYRNTFVVLLSLLFAGCVADSLEVKLKASDVESAINGKVESAKFEAEFGLLGKLDDEQRGQLDRISVLIQDYLDVDDVEIEDGDYKASLLIEGSLPVTSNPDEASAWFIKVSKDSPGVARVELASGRNYGPLKAALSDVNVMLAVEEFHPVKFKLKADKAHVMAPAVQIDGVTHLLFSDLIEGRLTMNFEGEPFKRTGAGFFLDYDPQ